jgi:Putative Flp pilus-assembly TadE/G-like
VPTVLIVLVFLGLLITIFWIVLPIGQATDQKTGSQAAADAAALAAAKQIGDDLPGEISRALSSASGPAGLLNLLSGVGTGFGREGAVEYAGRNGADVTSYQYSRFGDQIDVAVQDRATASTGGRAVSRARAELGVRLGDCRLTNDPVRTPSPTPTPSPTATPDPDATPAPPPPPADVGTVLRCGDLALHFTLDGRTGHPRLDSSLDDLRAQFRPKLTG